SDAKGRGPAESPIRRKPALRGPIRYPNRLLPHPSYPTLRPSSDAGRGGSRAAADSLGSSARAGASAITESGAATLNVDMVYLILPAYNEAAVIHDLLLAVVAAMRPAGVSYRVVLVDDGSSDDTVAEAERAVSESGGALPLTVVRHPANRGLGAGVRT